MSVFRLEASTLALLLLLVVSGCSSGSASSGTTPVSPPAPVVTDIYVAGQTWDGTESIAGFWKNGTLTQLGTPNLLSDTYAIAASGTDVYVAGEQSDGKHFRAVVWKNGIASDLTDGSTDATAYGIATSGTDVYVAGTEIDPKTGTGEAKLWKNGVDVSPAASGFSSAAYAVVVVNADVYEVGYVYETFQTSSGSTSKGVAAVWKNGVLTLLGSPNTPSSAHAISISGSDVYVAGSALIDDPSGLGNAVYWKNGSMVKLSAGRGLGASIFVSGQDVYVGGEIGAHTAMLWKNGVGTDLSEGSALSGVSQITVQGGSVYGAGFTVSGAAVWKDGVPSYLPAPSAQYNAATGLVVIQSLIADSSSSH